MKLALGTAQFGLNYGITNKSGQVNLEDAKAIILGAQIRGIDTIDTAIAYGESESCLGNVCLDEFKLVTKLPPIPDEINDVRSWVFDQVQMSLQRLGVENVYGLLLHSSQQLKGPNGKALVHSVGELKSNGTVKKFGVSIYSPSELDNLQNICRLDLVQAPFNLVDQRLKTSGWLHKLYEDKIEVHSRSTFLQGLLLMKATEIPEKFDLWGPMFSTWYNWLLNNNISAAEACLRFVQGHPQVSKIVVGVDNLKQLEQLTQLMQLIQAASPQKNIVWPNISSLDQNLINPTNWSRL